MVDKLPEERKVGFILRLQLILTVLICGINLLNFNGPILAFFSVFTVLTGIDYLYFFRTKRYNHWSNGFIFLVSIDFGYYVFSGGNQGAGILWSLVMPFLAMYLKGYKKGLVIGFIYLSALMAMVVIMFVLNVSMPYSNSFLFVFFFVNAAMLALLYKIEKGRSLIQEDYDRIENLFLHATDLLFIGNTNGFFLTVNPSCTDLLGWSRDELVKRNYLEFVHPDDREMTEAGNLNVFNTNSTGYNVLVNRFMCKDGTYKWLSWRTVVDTDRSLVYAVARDITERIRREELMLARTNLQSLIVEVSAEFINSSPESIESKMTELLCRIGHYLGYDRAYLVRLNTDMASTGLFEWCREGAQSLRSVFNDVDEDRLSIIRTFLMKHEQVYMPTMSESDGELLQLGKGLHKQEVKSVFLLPLINKEQKIALLGFDSFSKTVELNADFIELLKVLAHLLTEMLLKNEVDLSLREAAHTLDNLNRTKDKLFSIIAHDLRSPFSTIIGFTDMMKDSSEEISLDGMRRYSGLLNQLALSTFDLLENLLDWSRLQQGFLEPNRLPVYVEELVLTAIGPYAQKAASKRLLVNNIIEPGLMVTVDRRMMETVIRNIYTNALKFTPDGGVITVKAEKTQEDCLLLSISDSGIGIPDDMVPMLFTVKEEKNRPGLGGERSTGLGLMLCKEFVELHQGCIKLHTSETKGSIFCIYLPCLI